VELPMRGAELSSWKCDGCGSMWAPHVRKCDDCSGAGAKEAPAERLTFRQLWDQFKPVAEVKIPSWFTNQATHENHILAFYGDFDWREITHDRMDEYGVQRMKQKVPHKGTFIKPATVNRENGTVRSTLNWALRKGKITHNPASHWEQLEEISNRDFHLSQDEVYRLLDACSPLLRLMMVVAFETGMRRDEFRLLNWGEVHLKSTADGVWSGFVALPKERTKARKARSIPLSRLAIAAIQRARDVGLASSRYVFQSPKGDGLPLSRSTLYTWFVKARKLAGVKGPTGQNVCVHSARHTFSTTTAIESGMPTKMLMAIVGHSSPAMTDRYTHISRDHIEAASAYLDRDRHDPKSVGERTAEGAQSILKLLGRDK
jgi:integrase